MSENTIADLIANRSGRYFAGTGAKNVPAEIAVLMCAIAGKLTQDDHILRSGGDDGAQLAFESGVAGGFDRKQIFLPSKGYNGSSSQLAGILPACMSIAQSANEAWDKLSQSKRNAHARSVFFVLGYNLCSPSAFVVCWSSDAAERASECRDQGELRTVLWVAERNGVPVVNLCKPRVRQMFSEYVGEDRLIQAAQQVSTKGAPSARPRTGPPAWVRAQRGKADFKAAPSRVAMVRSFEQVKDLPAQPSESTAVKDPVLPSTTQASEPELRGKRVRFNFRV